MSVAAMEKIEIMTVNGMAPFQILGILRSEFDETFSYPSVYHAWSTSILKKFERHTGPTRSAILLSESDTNLKKIYEQQSPFGLGMVTSVATQVVGLCLIEELLIDSTFKTNKQSLELFAIIGSCHETGFPLSYFLLEAGTVGKENQENNL